MSSNLTVIKQSFDEIRPFIQEHHKTMLFKMNIICFDLMENETNVSFLLSTKQIKYKDEK